LIDGDNDFCKLPSSRRGDLGIDFVGGDFEQWFVECDDITLILQPPCDRALSDALTERWHLYRE
jgi:hypothetical protein